MTAARWLETRLLPLERDVDHPGNAELVDSHAEPFREERLAERHVDAAALEQRRELALGFFGIGKGQRDREAMGLALVVFGWRVGGHQHVAADRHASVHDHLLALRRVRHLRWR